jgi:hypothetical protein
MKSNVAPLDDTAVLAKVAAPITAAFGVGEDDRHITSIDEDGVALAAIKALSELHTRDQARIATLEREMTTVHAALAMLHRGR